MAQRVFFVIGVLLLAVVGVLYFLGRGRIETSTARPRARALEATSRIESQRLFFGDPKKIGFVEERRAVASGQNLETRARALVRELARGPLEGGLPVLPPETRLSHAFLDRWGVAYLDFEPSITATKQLDGREWLMVGSLVRSVCANFPEVRAVRFMIDGEIVSSLSGYIDLDEPLTASDFVTTP